MHATLVLHHFPRADADHDVVRFVMTAFEKMHVIRGNEADAKFFRQLGQHGIAFVLRFNPVIVQLEKEIFRA